jgi:16S rRNA (cytidine1402-2'-O)-methyltransferase
LERLRQALETGDVALVSDAGTPGLSDPGYLLVHYALDAGCQVSPIPGPSAPIAALVVSGLPTDSFTFLGYLPRRQAERRRLMEEISQERRTMLAFEVPHRLLKSLEDLEATFGGGRPIVVCRELTKVHEEILRSTLSEIREHFTKTTPRGEVTLVIGGATEEERWDEAEVRRALDEHMARGLNPSEAAREVAADAGWSRREVYRLTLEDS